MLRLGGISAEQTNELSTRRLGESDAEQTWLQLSPAEPPRRVRLATGELKSKSARLDLPLSGRTCDQSRLEHDDR